MPIRRIALWAFLLNMVWEFVQCVFLYDMWTWGFWRATAWMWGAIAGDVVIVLGITWLVHLAVGAYRLTPPDRAGWITLLSIGFVASIFFEWAAQALNLWGYSALMPMLEIAGYEVGLAPIVQITLLPAVSVYLGSRR